MGRVTRVQRSTKEAVLALNADYLIKKLIDVATLFPEAWDELQTALAIHDESTGQTGPISLHASACDGPESLDAILSKRRKAWTVPEFADLLNLSDRSLYDQIKNRTLPAIRIASILRICPAEALQWYREKVTSPTR